MLTQGAEKVPISNGGVVEEECPKVGTSERGIMLYNWVHLPCLFVNA